MTDSFYRYAFLASIAALAILYFLFDRRGRTIAQLTEDAARAKIAQSLLRIEDKAQRSDAEYEEAKKDYETLKRVHADLLARLGLDFSPRGRPPETRPPGNDSPH